MVKIEHSSERAPAEEDSSKMWSVTVRELIFGNKECRILVMRDLGPIRQNMILQFQNQMLSLEQSSIIHDMLTPIGHII